MKKRVQKCTPCIPRIKNIFEMLSYTEVDSETVFMGTLTKKVPINMDKFLKF
jgi:hypothetical protein